MLAGVSVAVEYIFECFVQAVCVAGEYLVAGTDFWAVEIGEVYVVIYVLLVPRDVVAVDDVVE